MPLAILSTQDLRRGGGCEITRQEPVASAQSFFLTGKVTHQLEEV